MPSPLCAALGCGTAIDPVLRRFVHVLTNLAPETAVTYVRVSDGFELFHVPHANAPDGTGAYQTRFLHAGGETVDILLRPPGCPTDLFNTYGLLLPAADATLRLRMSGQELTF
ncbi:MAG: hypothetical protein ACPGO3_09980 [Magnetospiraceae bacterium]